jgi:transcriptional antiterminator RfaH
VEAARWYVIQSHPRKEPLVRRRIAELGREVFLPTITERRNGQRKATTGPLFPGYLFARLSPDEGDLIRIRWTHGVRRVLGDAAGARPVEDAVVEAIRSRADSTGRVRLGTGLRRGAQVRILVGPLAGLVGILERPAATALERVCVLLAVFQRPTRVELPAQAICSAGA